MKKFNMFDVRPIFPGEHELLMPILDFQNACKANALTDDDGIGYLATSGYMTNMVVSPLDFARDKASYDERFTHVIWYNK